MTVTTTMLKNLSSPTIVIGTASTTLSGTVGSDSVLPVGQSVKVTIVGAHGVLASGSGTIASDGSFQVKINTAALPVGAYTIQYQYAGDGNFTASSGSGTLQVTYAIKLRFDTSKPVHPGDDPPIKLQVTDAPRSGSRESQQRVPLCPTWLPLQLGYDRPRAGNVHLDGQSWQRPRAPCDYVHRRCEEGRSGIGYLSPRITRITSVRARSVSEGMERPRLRFGL
jgi:hypothetical protein